MSTAPPLLISVPAAELNRTAPGSSVFDARKLLHAPFSHSLLRALQLVIDEFGPRHGELLCVARPEMFTHGESLQWLREHTRGATRHLCLSNGQTLKLVPGLHNEAFVYGLHREAGLRQYRNLLRRAPELLAGFEAQYNAAHETATATGLLSPPAEPLLPARPYTTQAMAWTYPFYLNRHSHADSSDRMLRWAGHKLPPRGSFQRVVVIDCCETAMHDAYFCHALAKLIARAAHDSGVCLLLLMPDPEDPKTEVIERIHRVLDGVQRGRTAVPRVRIDNVVLCSALGEQELFDLGVPFDVVLHEAAPLWAWSRAFYDAAGAIHLYLARQALSVRERLAPLQQALLGRAPVLHTWTDSFVARFGLAAH